MREGLSGHSPLERACPELPREAITKPMSDAPRHSRAGLILGVWGRRADSKNLSVPQASTRP